MIDDRAECGTAAAVVIRLNGNIGDREFRGVRGAVNSYGVKTWRREVARIGPTNGYGHLARIGYLNWTLVAGIGCVYGNIPGCPEKTAVNIETKRACGALQNIVR